MNATHHHTPETTTMNGTHDYELRITKTTRRAAGGGTWISGKIDDYRFDALVFPQHAEVADYEIGQSRISKLWVAHRTTRQTVYNWDRGLDLAATSPEVEGVVEFLCEGLATLVYGN
jgi:hypothetical protein